MDNTFLYKEYEECFKQLRYYDDRQFSLLRFAITISSSVAMGVFAIYKLFGNAVPKFWLAFVFISFVVCWSIFLIFWMMVRNRLYYIFSARQVNSIRKHLIKKEAQDFFEKNQMYVSVNISAFKKNSIQTVMFMGVLLLSTLFCCFCMGALVYYFGANFISTIWFSFIAGFMFFLINISAAYSYLKKKDNLDSDAAIRG